MVLAHLDALGAYLRGEEDDKGIAVKLFDLRPLIQVPDVVEGQRMELEGLLEEFVILVVRLLDVEPEASFALLQAFREV
jgi:hypothetical protein